MAKFQVFTFVFNVDMQARQQNSALSFHHDTQLPPSQDMMSGCPSEASLPHHPPDPPRHLLGENWVAETSQTQPSRMVTQAAAELGEGTSRDISSRWPLHKLGLHKSHRASPQQNRHQRSLRWNSTSFSSTSRLRPAHISVVQAARREAGSMRRLSAATAAKHPGTSSRPGWFPTAGTQWHSCGEEEADVTQPSKDSCEAQWADGAVCVPGTGQEGHGRLPTW